MVFVGWCEGSELWMKSVCKEYIVKVKAVFVEGKLRNALQMLHCPHQCATRSRQAYFTMFHLSWLILYTSSGQLQPQSHSNNDGGQAGTIYIVCDGACKIPILGQLDGLTVTKQTKGDELMQMKDNNGRMARLFSNTGADALSSNVPLPLGLGDTGPIKVSAKYIN